MTKRLIKYVLLLICIVSLFGCFLGAKQIPLYFLISMLAFVTLWVIKKIEEKKKLIWIDYFIGFWIFLMLWGTLFYSVKIMFDGIVILIGLLVIRVIVKRRGRRKRNSENESRIK